MFGRAWNQFIIYDWWDTLLVHRELLIWCTGAVMPNAKCQYLTWWGLINCEKQNYDHNYRRIDCSGLKLHITDLAVGRYREICTAAAKASQTHGENMEYQCNYCKPACYENFKSTLAVTLSSDRSTDLVSVVPRWLVHNGSIAYLLQTLLINLFQTCETCHCDD